MSLDDEQRRGLIAALLRGESTLTLATCDENGWPQATPLFYYVDDELALHWFSAARSAHSRHLAACTQAAVAVYRPTEHWREICGVQMRGEVTVVAGELRKKIGALYRERFHLGAGFGLMMMRAELYRFVPAWIRYCDNARGLGYKFDVVLR